MDDIKFIITNIIYVLLIILAVFILWTVLDIAFDESMKIRNNMEVNQIDRLRDNQLI